MTDPTPGEIADVLAGRARWCVVTGRWQNFAAQLPDKCVDHVITDPPYSGHVHSKSRAGARKTPLLGGNGKVPASYQREVDFEFAHITQAERVEVGALSERVCRRWCLAYSDVESVRDWQAAFPTFDYVRTCLRIVHGATPQMSGDRPGCGGDVIIVWHRRGRKRWNCGGKLGVYQSLTVINRGGQRHANTERVHTTQKDLAHTVEVIQDFTDLGDLVLDLYAGSGTTGVACLRTGRRFLGFEMREGMAAIARDRIGAECDQSTLSARKAGQLPMFGSQP